MLLFTSSLIASFLLQSTFAIPMPKPGLRNGNVELLSYGLGSYDSFSDCYYNIDEELKQFHMSPFQQLQGSQIAHADVADLRNIKQYLEAETGHSLLMFNEIVTGTCTVPPNTSMMQSFSGEAVTAVVMMSGTDDGESTHRKATLLFPSAHHRFACLGGESYCDTKTVHLKTNFS